MLTEVLAKLFERDLGKLKAEIEQYTNESDLWKTEGEITNSAGNLTLHLIGNLKHFIGATLGNSGYIRNRDLEFSESYAPRQALLVGIDETIEVVKATLSKLSDEELTKTYPIEVFGEPLTTEFFLVHLAGHLNWHLGQINYHRRLLSN
ncbi:MAG: DinB family protein [Pyrinomonadaceae bacterium]